MRRALDELQVAGVATNQAFHRRLMADAAFREATSTSSSSSGGRSCWRSRTIPRWSRDLAIAAALRRGRGPRAARAATNGEGGRRRTSAWSAGRRGVTASAEPVRIERIASGGDGVGRLPDGRTVFVPRSAPGDLVALARRGPAQALRAGADRTRSWSTGPERVVPPLPALRARRAAAGASCSTSRCRRSEARQARHRRRRAAAPGPKLEVADPHSSPAPAAWHYRSRITLHRAERADRIGLPPARAAGRASSSSRPATSPDRAVQELWRVLRRLRAAAAGDVRRAHAPARARWRAARAPARRRRTPPGPGAASWRSDSRAGGQPATVWWQPERGRGARRGRGRRPLSGDRVRAGASRDG